jgi:RNA polymerase sigma-70 factor (ECF subfamily)
MPDRDDPSSLNPVEVAQDPVLELVDKIQRGIDPEQNFRKLFERFRNGIRNLFLRKGCSIEDSRELTQEVFLRVFKSIGTFRGESRFERWLWEIAEHIYLNEIRKRHTEKREGLEQLIDAPAENDEGSIRATEIPAPGPSPQQDAVQREQIRKLREALQELPDQMRRCCVFRYEKDYKYQEIADLMGISIETVKAHLHQARKRLTARLGGAATPDGRGNDL